MHKKLILLALSLSIFAVSCSDNPDDPARWVKKFNENATEREAALNKLEFIYEMDTTLHTVCKEILAPNAWREKRLQIANVTKPGEQRELALKEGEKKFDRYKDFCGKHFKELNERIPKFRKIVIPALLKALNDPVKNWHQDLMIKLLIRFQDPQKPIKPESVQDYFIKVIEDFGGDNYDSSVVDPRTVVALRGLEKLNEKKPHPKTFEVLGKLLKKIYTDPVQYDSISSIRLALVDLILGLRGKGNHPLMKKFSQEASKLLVKIIERGEHDTADPANNCGAKLCKQNFLINKRAAVKLGELGISNSIDLTAASIPPAELKLIKDVTLTLVTCLYSVEKSRRRRKSFRECKIALSKLYKPSFKNRPFDPVGILALLAEGDPARYPQSYSVKKEKWYTAKEGGKLVVYGSDKHQSSTRSKTIKSCLKNYEKFRESDYFRFVSLARWKALKKFHGRETKTEKFNELFKRFVQEHKERTDKWGEGACRVFVLNTKGEWDEKDSAVVERTALEALRGMGAGSEIQRILLETYSSFAMTAYWRFTAKQYLIAAHAKCKKEGMFPNLIKTNCLPQYNDKIAGIKSQWNKLKDYNWLVDASKEAMYGAGWLTSELSSEIARRVKDELVLRLRWLKDPRSTVFAAKAISMLPFEKSVFNELMAVVIAKVGEKAEESRAEKWHIATELLWEQFRQQALQLLKTKRESRMCKRLEGKMVQECEEIFNKRFEVVGNIFGQWSYNQDRWLRSRHIWLPTIQDFFGYWPKVKGKKFGKRPPAKERYLEYLKWKKICDAKQAAWKKANPGENPDYTKMPYCVGYDTSKEYAWTIRKSEGARAMRKARISAKEAEKRLVLAGYERIRLDMLEAAFDYADVAHMAELLKIQASDIMADPGPHPLEKVKRKKLTEAQKIDLELMVQRPWDDKMEADRKKRAAVVIKGELDKLKKPFKELKTFLKTYANRTGDIDLNNVSTLREIVKTVSIQKDCPERTKKGKIPACAVFENKYDDATSSWKKIRKPSKMTIVTPWRARRKALMLLNGWDKEINPMDRTELVRVLAETYGKSEVAVRRAILLVLDRWAQGGDYKIVSKPILEVVEQETNNHRRGGFFWMNQDALALLGRLKGKGSANAAKKK